MPGWGNGLLTGVAIDTFSTQNFIVTHDIATLADGSSILAISYFDDDGEQIGLVRLDPTGHPDSGFGVGGYAKTGIAVSGGLDEAPIRVFLKSDGAGHLFLASTRLDLDASIPKIGVCRINATTGALTPFAPAKPSCVEINQHIAMNLFVQADGKLLVVGLRNQNGVGDRNGNPAGGGAKTDGIGAPNQNFRVTRLNTDGSIDASYASGGIAIITLPPGEIAPLVPASLASNDNLIVAILHDNGCYLRRLTDQGVVDASWSAQPPVLLPDPLTHYAIYHLLAEKRSGSVQDDVVVLGIVDGEGTFIARLRGDTGQRDVLFGTEKGYSLIDGNPYIAASRIVSRPGGGYFAAVGAVFGFNESVGSMIVTALDRQGVLDTDFGTDGSVSIGIPFSSFSYGAALSYRDGALYVGGGTYFESSGELTWLEAKLGIDRIFADGFENTN